MIRLNTSHVLQCSENIVFIAIDAPRTIKTVKTGTGLNCKHGRGEVGKALLHILLLIRLNAAVN